MLDKTSERILKLAISKYAGDMEKDILIFPNESNLDYTELNSVCSNLCEFEYFKTYYNSLNNTKPAEIQLSHKGLHYFEMKKKNFFYICIKSVWMPLTVSLLANIIISVSKWLLPMILQ